MRRIRIRRPSVATAALSVAWLLFCAWVAAGWWAGRAAGALPYDTVARRDGYEVRRYGPSVAAAVSVSAPWSEALRQGQALLSAYVGGDNTTQESVAAGHPATVRPEGIRIADGLPFFASARGQQWHVLLPLPPEWTDVTLPRPNDPRIRILRMPERTVAVRTFTGASGADRIASEEERLRSLLQRDGTVTLGPASVAQYHPAWAPPFLRRTEVMVPVREPSEGR